MKKLMTASAILTALSAGGCMQTPPSVAMDSFHEYTQRLDVVTSSAGDAQAINSRIQEIDPWPRYVGNKSIVANGQRVAGAVERYRDVSQQDKGPHPLPLEETSK
jgi:hypothetical protein